MNEIFLEDAILTVPELAKYLKISRSKAYYICYKRQIPVLRLGRNIRIRQSDLLKWINSKIESPQ